MRLNVMFSTSGVWRKMMKFHRTNELGTTGVEDSNLAKAKIDFLLNIIRKNNFGIKR